MKNIYLFAVKIYKGLFRKKFERAEVGILLPTKSSVYLFIIYLGTYEDPKTGKTQNLGVLAGSISESEIPTFLDSMASTYKEHFTLIDEVPAKVKYVGNSITVTPTTKGKYIRTPITIEKQEELSKKKHMYFSVKGDLPEFFSEEELDDVLAGMKAMNVKSKFKAFMSMSAKELKTLKH
jgi:hypothetical protein